MKVTLIYPGFAYVGFDSLGKGNMDRNWINLGLSYLGACLKQAGHECDLIDIREMLSWDHLEQEVRSRNSDLYGVHINTPNVEYALRCAEIAARSGKPVIAGGPHATIAPEELLKPGYINHVIIGEGERTMVDLVTALESNQTMPSQINGQRVENLDDLPFPDRDLYNTSKVLGPQGNFPFLDNGVILMASRGCPFSCSFCQPLVHKMFGNKVRYRSVANVIEELKFVIKKYNVPYVSFQDDTFTFDKEWVLELCEAILKEGIKLQWSAQSRVNTFNDDLASAMSRAGCVCIFFGFESGSQRILDILRKGITPEQSRKAAQLCRKHGIIMLGDYMLGMPTETEEDLKATVDLIRDIRPEIPSPTYFTPVPGCELYEFCKQKGLIKIKKYSDFMRNPMGEKISGIDYEMINKYRDIMLSYTPRWYQEAHFRRLSLRRWWRLLQLGYYGDFLREVSIETSPEFTRVAVALRNWVRNLFGHSIPKIN